MATKSMENIVYDSGILLNTLSRIFRKSVKIKLQNTIARIIVEDKSGFKTVSAYVDNLFMLQKMFDKPISKNL